MMVGSERALELLKWVGGKRRLLPRLIPRLKRALARGGPYYEPFLGSAVVFLSLVREVELPAFGAYLSDKSPNLIWFYRTLGDDHRAVYERLRLLRQLPPTKETFEQIRDAYNKHRHPLDPMQAARFLYMNRVGFNGLWRTNDEGLCNVPYGFGTGTVFPSERLLARAGAHFKRQLLAEGDFETEIDDADEGAVIYADPPYDETYDGYSGGFTDADQARLAGCLRRAHERGAFVLVSNLDTPRVRELYSWAHFTPLRLQHIAGGKGTRRSLAPELLIQAPPPPKTR